MKYFYIKEFSFDTHCFTVLNEFLPEIAGKLHEEITFLFNMTRRT